MNKDLEKLIDLALADGLLTDKEKQVLLKKAQTLNVDQDEFDLILEGRLHLLQKSTKPNTSNVTKCPNCGDLINGLSKVCPTCNFILSNTLDSMTPEKAIDTLEEHLVRLKTMPKPNFYAIVKPILLIYFSMGTYIIYKKLFKKEHIFSSNNIDFDNALALSEKQIRLTLNSYGDNPRVKKLIEELTSERNSVVKERKKARMQASLITVGIFLIIIILLIQDETSHENNRKNNSQRQVLIEQALTENSFNDAKEIALQLNSNAKEDAQAMIYKAEVLFNIKKGNLETAEEVFFACPPEAYGSFRNVASNIVQAYLDKNKKKKAASFINKIDTDYDNGDQQKKLKKLLK